MSDGTSTIAEFEKCAGTSQLFVRWKIEIIVMNEVGGHGNHDSYRDGTVEFTVMCVDKCCWCRKNITHSNLVLAIRKRKVRELE